jgi:hypothetical protein
MDLVKSFSKYIIIVIIGISLAFLVARIQYDTSDLWASVLSLTEQDFFESTQRDAWYKKENQIFEIFLSEQVRNDWELEISLLSAPSDFIRITDELTSSYWVDIVNQDKWILVLSVSWYENWNFSEWILQIPFSGNSKDVTLEYISSSNHKFAIWSLDNIQSNTSH